MVERRAIPLSRVRGQQLHVRKYCWTISGNVWTWSRNALELSLRMVLTIPEDGQSIEAKGSNGVPVGGCPNAVSDDSSQRMTS
jgi:hypothetical protein